MNKYLAFVLDGKSREKLIKTFPPTFPKVICHHVTIEFNITNVDVVEKYIDITKAQVIGYASDGALETLVVSIGGTYKRDDGGIYHITHSLIPGKRKPVDSNKLLRKDKWTPTPIVMITGKVKLENK